MIACHADHVGSLLRPSELIAAQEEAVAGRISRARFEAIEDHAVEAAIRLHEIESLSAVTLATHDMARALRFYSALGFSIRYGGGSSAFTSFHAGEGYLNLIVAPGDQVWSGWGRVIFYVSDVDGMYRHALAQGLQPESAPRDAEWGERYFHIADPDGHELSFAKPLVR
jgi:catechol 2,3-dioxygenase-like lactoylglutathione lyase family enzyme